MKKNLENITEELIMRYVEGDLNLEEYRQFTKIMSENEYLSNRVDSLKTISTNAPEVKPSQEVHNKILDGLNINKPKNNVLAKKYINTIVGFFENRPFVLGASMSGLVVAFILILNINSQSVNEDSIEISEEVEQSDKKNYQYSDKDESVQ